MAEQDRAEGIVGPWLDALLRSTGALEPFDAHTHIGRNDPDGFRQTPEQLLGALGRIDARAACFAMAEPDGYSIPNDTVIATAEASEGRLVPYCRLDPRDDPLTEARRCMDAGARGIKLHPRAEGFTLAEPSVIDIFAFAHELAVPLLIHAGRGIPALGEQAIELARAYPAAKVILAHSAVSDLAWLWRVLPEVPNVFIDTSWWNPADLMALFTLVRPGQILWASDSPYGRPSGSLAFQLRCAVQAGLSPDSIRMIAGGQMDRLLSGEPGLDLGPAPGPSPLTDPALERIASHLYSAFGRAIEDQDTNEPLSLAELACSDPSHPQPELLLALLELIGLARDAGIEQTEDRPHPPEIEFIIAALLVARTPAAAVPGPAPSN
ncbi:MAG TPA: amidohydrolase family protein [Solirubrobacterales bacterium]|nr:amidohydrolase family protein [Solirubrobacterales bacterium]